MLIRAFAVIGIVTGFIFWLTLSFDAAASIFGFD